MMLMMMTMAQQKNSKKCEKAEKHKHTQSLNENMYKSAASTGIREENDRG